MSQVLITEQSLIDVANAIRSKLNVQTTYKPGDFANAIISIPGGATVLQSKTVAPTEQSQTVTADAGYNGLSSVTVSAISSTYVGSGITRRSSTSVTVSDNTVTIPAGYYSSGVTKNVPTASHDNPTISINSSTGVVTASHTQTAGYVSADTATDTLQLSTQVAAVITPSNVQQTAVGAGKYTLGAVTVEPVEAGTAGIPVATKGTVSNHTVTITPSVTNITGYISGGTKTGTSVSVSASELVSGSQTVTSNNTYDVTNLASLIVNVASGGSGLVYETGTYTPTSNVSRPTISWTNSHTEAPILVVMTDVTGPSTITSSSNIIFFYWDPYKIFGSGFPYDTSTSRYAFAYYCYRGSSNLTGGSTYISNNSDSTTATGTSYPRYWASPTDFHPYSNSASRYWRSGRTYKWIAVWKPTS